MKIIIVLALIVAGMLSFSGSQIFAAEKAQLAGIVEGNNTLCPVSGKPVSGKDFVIYKGKRYGLCCPACKAVFLKSPAKYVAKMIRQEPKQIARAKVTPAVLMPQTTPKRAESKKLS